MRYRTRLWAFAISAVLLSGLVYGADVNVNEPDPVWDEDNAIDLVICLDTSGSMTALIETVNLKLWEIVNVLADVEPAPRLRVALVTYGNRTGGKDGWVRLETGLTEDLDLVSQRLSSLVSEKGGMEYVGRALQLALDNLDWNSSDRALKLIFVAGNESTDQDPNVSFKEMSQIAYERGIFVHAIFCGKENADTDTWKEMAELARGQFSTINHLDSAAIVATPFDRELAALSAAASRTYIPLGEEGREKQQNQVAQDESVLKLGLSAAASRARTKISPIYSTEWDLVAALEADRTTLAEVDPNDLPESMQRMSDVERENYVAELTFRRDEIRQRIVELSEQRSRFISEHAKSKGLDGSGTFDSVVREILEHNVEEKGLQLRRR